MSDGSDDNPGRCYPAQQQFRTCTCMHVCVCVRASCDMCGHSVASRAALLLLMLIADVPQGSVVNTAPCGCAVLLPKSKIQLAPSVTSPSLMLATQSNQPSHISHGNTSAKPFPPPGQADAPASAAAGTQSSTAAGGHEAQQPTHLACSMLNQQDSVIARHPVRVIAAFALVLLLGRCWLPLGLGLLLVHVRLGRRLW